MPSDHFGDFESGRRNRAALLLKGIPLLSRGKIVGILYDPNGIRHQLGPLQLIHSKHHSSFKSSFHQPLIRRFTSFNGQLPINIATSTYTCELAAAESAVVDPRVPSVQAISF